jgi:hypothetical protein
VRASDLQKTLVGLSIHVPPQDFPPQREVLFQHLPVGDVIDIFLAEKIIPSVKLEELLVGQTDIGEDITAGLAPQNARVEGMVLLPAAKDTGAHRRFSFSSTM